MGDLTTNFSRSEFACKCGCGLDNIDLDFVNKLQLLRESLGPLVISSGLRCEKYNKQVGGVPKSAHLRGFAVDISCTDGVKRYWIARKAFEIGFIGVGIHKHFVHIDNDPTLVRPALWLY